MSHLVLLGRIKIILRGEGEVGRFEQVTPCQEEKMQESLERKREKWRKSERQSFLLFGCVVTKRTENISAREEKIAISCAA